MNHLLIGLGGTGGRVLRSFRKLMYRSFRDEAPDDAVIDYLFVDSDPKSFVDGDPGWTVLGRSVQLPKRSQLLIAQANLISVVNDLNSHPNLKPWLGDRAAWGEILASLNIDAAGGQKRRLGRFLFAMSATKFRDAVTTIVQDMQGRGGRSNDATFHIFTGLAGGTGSGAVVDAIAQIRALYPDPKKRIIVYAYLPDLNPPPNWNTGNYHANAYAALTELNALSAGTFAPFDVVNAQGPVANPTGFWFNGCYVYTDENAQGFRAGIDRDLSDIVADFVFHKTVVARQINWDGLVRMENSENGDATPETAAGSKQGQRSVRFLSFGIRRVAFPEEIIREYLTYEFSTQALRQLAYNNWQDGVGYLEQPKPSTDAEFAASKAQREEWRVTDEHLRLARPVIDTEGSKRWLSYEQEWSDWQTNYRTIAQRVDKLKWLNELTTLFNNTWTTNYRGAGVQQFFQTARKDRKNLARAIVNRVEQSLFEDWKNGVKSISDSARVLAALMDDLATRALAIDDFAAKREASAADLHRQFGQIEARWDRLRIIPGERERELDKASFLIREQMVAQTLAEAARFSKELIEELSNQLTELKVQVDQAEAVVLGAATEALNRVQARASAVQPTDGETSYVTTVSDPKVIDTTRRRLVLNEEEQRAQTTTLRNRILQALGQQPTFALFARRFAETDITNAIVAIAEENVASAHQRLVTERAERVIGVSVIEKLRDQWGTDQEKLNSEASALVRSAGRFAPFDETELNKSYPGKTATPRAVEQIAVMMPQPAEQSDYVDQLKTAFKNARSGGDVGFVDSPDDVSEISVVSLTNLFPLRFVRLVRGLKERYELRAAQVGRPRAVLEVHTEGDGSQFPDLFVAEQSVVTAKLRPVLLLAKTLGVAEARKVKTKDQLVLIRKDPDGFELDPLVLGADVRDASGNLSESDYFTLRDAVMAKVAAGGADPDATRTAMLAELAAMEGGASAPSEAELGDWNTAAREAMKVLRGESAL